MKSTKPSELDVLIHRTLNNTTCGIEPLYQPHYTRIMKRTIPPDIMADADKLFDTTTSSWWNAQTEETEFNPGQQAEHDAYVKGRIEERAKLDQAIKDAWNAAANFYKGMGSYPNFEDWSKQYKTT